jgi:neutral ceramidase
VACDMIGIPRPIVEAARAEVEKTTGIPADHVMISATHAHTGPVVADRNSRYHLEGGAEKIANEYAAALPRRIAEAVAQARAALRSARVSTACGHENAISFNRRYFMSDGTVGWNPGKRNPRIVRPAGPIDPGVPVVYIDSPDARPIATYVNFAMHPDTVGGLEFSADYAYTLSTLLGAVRGPEMVTLFTNGAAGNINHVDVRSAAPQRGHGEAARLGTVLAADVLKLQEKLAAVADGPLAVHREIVKLPLAPFAAADLPRAREVAAKFGLPNASPFLEQVQAFKVLDVVAREGRPLEAEVQVIALGSELAWVGLPGEIFTELGAAIKRASPFRQTIVAELANGSLGYVPNREAYAQGNYEVVSARMAAGSGELLVDTAARMLRELYPRR